MPALDLLLREVESSSARKTGLLEVVFQHGACLITLPAEGYEPWQFSGAGGVRVVAMPSGGLQVWRAEQAE